jgi:uncharacterized protein DUF3309
LTSITSTDGATLLAWETFLVRSRLCWFLDALMIFAAIVLTAVFGVLVAFLPVWRFSRGWGYAPAIIVGMVFLTLLAMTFAGLVPGMSAGTLDAFDR